MKTIYLIAIFFFPFPTFGQTNNPFEFKRIGVNLNFEKECNGTDSIIRKNPNLVKLLFHQRFNDTISIILNNKEINKTIITIDSLNISSSLSGEHFEFYFQKPDNEIKICYWSSRSFIEFKLDKSYPFYSIYNLGENGLFVSGRKCILSIR